ncbi:MAG TPA: hypothetical protein PLK68_05340 [Thomasclavelia ramosa]|nr:hypothetical protein [Thomasclavelia ramosa]
MEVNVKQAQKIFFSKSSFEMIYFEAFVNALDAKATEFTIKIDLPNKDQTLNLSLELLDNGVGFDNVRFSKFCKLFDVEEQSHKGLGRLVYLCYFDQVHVESFFEKTKKRIFDFNENFNEDCELFDVPETNSRTALKLTSFSGNRLAKNQFIDPLYIKKVLLENFYMKFYKAKLAERPINVVIQLTNGSVFSEQKISVADLPEFQKEPLTDQMNLFDKMELYYFIKEVPPAEHDVITAIAVDDRSMKVDIIANENLPVNYQMIFLLISESFKGDSDSTRMNLTMDDVSMSRVRSIFKAAIASVVKKEIPKVEEANKQRINYLINTFPHLKGYFETDDVGYSSQTDVLKKAQDHFFKDQREILCAKDLTDEQFEKSLNLSARSLAEYILFRQNVIKKMKSLTGDNKEADLHNLIAPKNSEFMEGELSKDLYSNNVWVLDDKFMSYCTVLSEAEMSKVIDVITKGEVKDNDDDRPDITLFFSADPNKGGNMVDIVVVELKRLGIKAEQNSIVEFQLDTRTQRLAEYYGKRIQRMWFYGIVDFDNRYEMHLINNGFRPLFSKGSVYFRSKPIFTDKSQSFNVVQNTYILDFKALVEDANSRNSTFLSILQNQFVAIKKNS